jgi:hypothetical protein
VTRKPVVADRRLALWGGVLMLCVGSFLVYDAYEGRGRSRPFVTKFLPI